MLLDTPALHQEKSFPSHGNSRRAPKHLVIHEICYRGDLMDHQIREMPTIPAANDSSPPVLLEDPAVRHAVKVTTGVAFGFIFLTGVTGNGVVLWVTGWKLRWTSNTVWFFNLALADLASTSLILITVLNLALDLDWPFGSVACKVANCLFGLSLCSGVLLLSSISVDRCVLVVAPVWCQNYRTPRLTWAACGALWLLSLAFFVPSSYFFTETSVEKNRTSCSNLDVFQDWQEAEVLTICIFLYQFLMPLLVISISYTVLVVTMRKKKFNKSSKPLVVVTRVIFCFFLCWLPYHALALARISMAVVPDVVRMVAIPLSKCLAMFNSCINPLLYVFVGQEFQDAVRRSLLQVFKTAFEEAPIAANV
ncbi:chemerin-like receptor 1 [Sphaerodactylus townsendi]|uniref:chemerin-like receptor 1 n=1 Tax=Sphaerodactylus townsendi TaxID=933632 RepID=UPI0020260E41|nr:chemerin-like receptor 1 [Sphaerodactylus townsendi]